MSKQKWHDTKLAAKQLGVGNKKLLHLLKYHNLFSIDNHDIKHIHPAAKSIARLRQSSWFYPRTQSQQWYTVVQLSGEGLEVAERLIQADKLDSSQSNLLAINPLQNQPQH